MPPRATYLARLLVSRANQLEGALAEDALDEAERVRRRQEMVAKVLVVEEGVTDGLLVQLVTNALPRIDRSSRTPDREMAEFAGILSKQLKLQ